MSKSKKPFDNEERTRYYGLRVGDIVSPKGLGRVESSLGKCKVVSYCFDNNRVKIQSIETGEQEDWVAEWCTIITKVEDIVETVEITASVLSNYQKVVSLLTQAAVYNLNGYAFDHKKQDIRIAIVNLAYAMKVDIDKLDDAPEKSKNLIGDILLFNSSLSLMMVNSASKKEDFSSLLGIMLKFIEIH